MNNRQQQATAKKTKAAMKKKRAGTTTPAKQSQSQVPPAGSASRLSETTFLHGPHDRFDDYFKSHLKFEQHLDCLKKVQVSPKVMENKICCAGCQAFISGSLYAINQHYIRCRSLVGGATSPRCRVAFHKSKL